MNVTVNWPIETVEPDGKLALSNAEARLLSPHGSCCSGLEKALSNTTLKRFDYVDVFVQQRSQSHWSLDDGQVKDAWSQEEQGVGVRGFSGEQSVLACASNMNPQAMDALVGALPGMLQAPSHAKHGGQLQAVSQPPRKPLYGQPSGEHPIIPVPDTSVAWLHQVDDRCRAYDPRIVHVSVSFSMEVDDVLMLSQTDGWSSDQRPLVRLDVHVVASAQGRTTTGFRGCGGRYPISVLRDPKVWGPHADEACRLACLNLEARPAPAGTFPVVLGAGWPAVMLHEAVGHGLEGDFHRKRLSTYTDRVGEQVASPLCTVVDAGNLPLARGSQRVDDEGVPCQRNVLIEDGYLKQTMLDRHTAFLTHQAPTGNGRRASYACLPMPRMTNTFLMPGDEAPEALLASLDRGLFATQFSGGEVDITSGQFVFSACEAYWVEQGVIQYPVRGVTLTGHGPTALQDVSMVGNDWALDPGMGVCGKQGQSVPVGVGQPSIKVNAMTVGGTEPHAGDA